MLNRVRKITGKDFAFYAADLLDKESVNKIFLENEIEGVIHFAGLKAVGESVEKPLWYYHNNLFSTVKLLEVMEKYNVKKLVFSSSATVYRMTEQVPINEEVLLGTTNPYGRTKQMIEEILRDLGMSDHEWSVALLRYFDPIGAHKSGRIGEDPNGNPNNLLPYISQVAVGKLDELNVFGNDYPISDGTGIRDYIHVVDLAIGHLGALGKVLGSTGVEAYNLGTGNGYSVLEIVDAFKKASGRNIPYKKLRHVVQEISEFAMPIQQRQELN